MVLALLVGILPQLSAQVVGKPARGTFALTNATIETVTKGTVTGTLVITDGKITAIGTAAAPAGATVIDCTGKFVYPGFIDSGTHLGLIEVGSISVTQDENEIGDVKPYLKALTAVNPNSVAIPVTRVGGVTTVLTMPEGGLVPGTAALINLIGYTPDQMYAGFQAVRMNFPSSGSRGRWDRRSDEDRKKEEDKKLKELNDLWDNAKLFADINDAAKKDATLHVDYNPTMEAMIPVVRGEMMVLIEADREADIRSALKWIKEKEINAILTGCAEGWRVAKEIAAAGVPVITGPMLQNPARASDRYDRPYANAGLMQKAGVKVAIRTNDTENVRNLPFNAGFAAAYGMGREEALKAITIVPAQLMGVADRLGSLEVGKSATLFICDGDPFETKTQIEQVFIDGWEIPMDSRHIQLYNEFLERTPGLKK